MRLARYLGGGSARIALVDGNEFIDVAEHDPDLPRSMTEFLMLLPHHHNRLEALARVHERQPMTEVRWLAPIEEPRRFIAVGLNYRDHAQELGLALPERPRLFVKLAGTLSGPYDAVHCPADADTLDYEGELAFVIGKRCHAVHHSRAHEVVAGFIVLNDLGLRQYVNPDLVILGKGCAGFAPCGPWLTTSDEIGDPHALSLQTRVNGELRQDSSTGGMIFDCWQLIEWITRVIVLEPGDLITTGSPRGSGGGLRPPRYLCPGDQVRVEIAGLGAIENRIVAHSSEA